MFFHRKVVKKAKEKVKKELKTPKNMKTILITQNSRKNSTDNSKQFIHEKKPSSLLIKEYIPPKPKIICQQCLFLLRRGLPMKYCDIHNK